MELKSLSPNLGVADVDKTVEYYEKNLGFKLMMSMPKEGKLDWAMMMNGDVVIMFQEFRNLERELPNFKSREPGTFTLYVQTDDVEGYYNLVRNRVEILKEIFTTFYGSREFALRDLNGYIINVATSADDD